LVSFIYAKEGNKAFIEVYYESLCPDSRDFFINSYAKFLNTTGSHELAHIDVIPYGNENQTFNLSTQLWDFECQHGPNECYGNDIQIAAVYSQPQNVSHALIVCLFSHYSELRPGNITFEQALHSCNPSIDQSLITLAKSRVVNQLHHISGQLTPNHTFIPWVMVNGKRDDSAANEILRDMLGYLCSLREEEELDACKDVVKPVKFLLFDN